MRCKQGDEAILTKGKQAGLVVKCLEFIGRDSRLPLMEDLWRIDVPIRWSKTYASGREDIVSCSCASDSHLIPINPDSEASGEDFTVALTEKQKETIA